MDMEQFVLDHPWAKDLPRSELMMRLLRRLQRDATIEQLHSEFPALTEDDLAEALYVLKRLGVVDGDGERVWLSPVGKEFLQAYDETFG